MSSFSIDDVRETFTADMTNLIGNLEHASAELCRSPLLDRNAWPTIPPLFDSLTDSSHSIAGTSGLVAAASLHESARLLETLAEGGRELLKSAAVSLAEARRVAEICSLGAVSLRAMLDLELDHRGDEALGLARAFNARVEAPDAPRQPSREARISLFDELLEPPVRAIAAAPAPQDFTFDEAAPPRPDPDSEGDPDCLSPGADAELQSIFAEEAREGIAVLHTHLRTLEAEPAGDHHGTLGNIERIFHTLKGAAATVRQGEANRLAEALQRRAEELIETEGWSVPDAVRDLTAEIRRLEALVCGDGAPAARAPAEVVVPAARRVPDPVVGAPRGNVAVRESVSPISPEIWDTFHQECLELLDRLDRAIQDLEASDRPKQVLEGIAGVVHTLKGAANAVGISAVGQEIHRVEDFLEELAEAPILPPMRGVARLLFSVHAGIRANLGTAPKGYVETSPERLEAQIARVFVGGRSEGPARAGSGDPATGKEPASSGEPISVGSDGAEGRKYIRVGTERLDSLMNLAGELVVSRSRLTTRVQALRTLQLGLAESRRRLLDTVERFRSENEFSMLGRPHRSGPGATELREAAARSGAGDAALASFGELELDRYDDVNILARALAEITDDVSDTHAQLFGELASFSDDSDAFGAIVSGIQGEVTRARMVPLEAVFTRLILPIRDAAERQGKEIHITTVGGQVSLDKSIADALFSPLLHLVRNAVYHGVEAPSARARAGKEARGELRLVAREESGQIVVEVHDDGAGLDLAALRARGVAMGLVQPGTPLTDPSIRDLVFASRLSTAPDVGAVAGRGVGGDVVRRAVERLNGNIRVESEAGRGTSFIARLPLTLAITRSLIVRHRGRGYAVPLHFAERILDVDPGAFVESAGTRRIEVDGAYLTLRSLSTILEIEGAESRRGPVLILRVGDQRGAVQVDAVVGQEEIVVKSLGDVLTGHPLFAGVTIRGSGDLVLIFDVPALLGGRGEAAHGPTAEPEEADESAKTRAASTAEEEAPRPAAARKVAVATVAAAATAAAEPRVHVGSAPARIEPITAVAPPSRLRVLFVDDSLSVRKVAEKALQSLGAEVVLAVDGVDALSKLREQPIDLVFTDLEMPRMHGYDLIRELRFIPAHASLPVVVVSSRSAQKHQEQARALGASGYITKPFTTQALDTALTRWGRGKHRSSSGGQGLSR